jgi:tryptophan-rich sensory protein
MKISRQVAGLISWLLVTFVAAAFGAIASIHASSFYGQLNRPTWAPPGWLFGPVWCGLYFLMGVSAWLVWRQEGFRPRFGALGLFLLQLTANGIWSWLFFGWHHGALAFGDIILLWLLIVATIITFWRANRLAGALLIPYLLWVSFAAVLNYSIWQLNPHALA